MKSIFAALSLTALAFFGNPNASEAEVAPFLPTAICTWQFAWMPFGIGNWLWVDTANRWWYIPVDAQWRTYPKARFFRIRPTAARPAGFCQRRIVSVPYS